MNHGNNRNDDINLDLSLRIGPREEDPVEEQGPFMELLTSENNRPPHSLEPSLPRDPWDLTLALSPIPQVENSSLPASSPSSQLNQGFPSMQPEALETQSTRLTPRASLYHHNFLPIQPRPGALDTPNIRPRLSQPPVENGSFAALSPYQQFHHEFYPPVQPGALKTPSTRPRLGRPPTQNQRRRNSSEAVAGNINLNEEEIIPKYPWTTTKPAVVHNIRYLTSNNINMINGQVYCKPCNKTITLEYNLMEKFSELSRYIDEKESEMRNRASDNWMNPELTSCSSCHSGMKPFPSANMEDINWLFLFLGQMLGCCNLEQLRYFCDKTKQHQTGSKYHVLYQTYLSIYKQLKSD